MQLILKSMSAQQQNNVYEGKISIDSCVFDISGMQAGVIAQRHEDEHRTLYAEVYFWV